MHRNREYTQYENTCTVTHSSIGSCREPYKLVVQMEKPLLRPGDKLSVGDRGHLLININNSNGHLLINTCSSLPLDADHDVSTWRVQMHNTSTFTAVIPFCIQEGFLRKAGLYVGLNRRFARVFIGENGESYMKIFRDRDAHTERVHTIPLSGTTAWQHCVTKVRVPWLLGQHWLTFSRTDGRGRSHSLLLGPKQLRTWEDAVCPRKLTVGVTDPSLVHPIEVLLAFTATEEQQEEVCAMDLSSSVESLPSLPSSLPSNVSCVESFSSSASSSSIDHLMTERSTPEVLASIEVAALTPQQSIRDGGSEAARRQCPSSSTSMLVSSDALFFGHAQQLANEMDVNEIIIEEREDGIREIETLMVHVKDFFKHVALLVHEQGETINTIDNTSNRAKANTDKACADLEDLVQIPTSYFV
jgi:hypothetical protein